MPVSFDVDCVHRRTNVPAYEPLYVPFQLPDSTGPATGGNDLVGLVGAATLDWRADVTLAAGEVDNGADADDVEDVALLDEHAATSAAAAPTTKISFVRFMSSPPRAERLAVAEYEPLKRPEIHRCGPQDGAASQAALRDGGTE
ncbi:MAG: hypothetical protein ACRDVG_08110 [Jatrophihabitantaceae bacterium]